MRLARGALCLVALVWLEASARSEIRHVSHQPAMIETASGKPVEIRFNLSEPAQVTFFLIDARGLVIRSVESDGELAAGDQRLRWDGRDERGASAPPEAYTYTLEARNADGELSRWDISEFGGDVVDVEDLRWDAKSGRVTYRLDDLARVRIRLGLEEGGPLLRTLIDWVPRLPAQHSEAWDGSDASSVMALAQHPALRVEASAFSLPRNTIVIGPPEATSRFVAEPLPPAPPRAQPDKPEPHRMFDYARQSVEARRDFSVSLSIPGDLERTAQGIPIISGPIPVRVEATGGDIQRAANERSEAVFFVDGRFVFERETGFLPMTWTWDPTGHAPGPHHLTVNVRSYEGHFGIGTTLVQVAAPAAAKD